MLTLCASIAIVMALFKQKLILFTHAFLLSCKESKETFRLGFHAELHSEYYRPQTAIRRIQQSKKNSKSDKKYEKKYFTRFIYSKFQFKYILTLIISTVITAIISYILAVGCITIMERVVLFIGIIYCLIWGINSIVGFTKLKRVFSNL